MCVYLYCCVASGEVRYLLTQFSLGSRAKTDVLKVNPCPPKASLTAVPSALSKDSDVKLIQVGRSRDC